ncbi:MAG: phospholipid/cholesterol/gamma-HCH transport system substrate-binding protein [Actinomycetota bacterium]|jgi:phospholipid/cholesterol/gamma-HCH transport system substrate-binding protein|nr:phospholipid/cholesterol/gamma-HCH transport system substrate-binding protein [Actinomycetota bacterium]
MMASLRWTTIKLLIFTAVTIVVTVWLAGVIGNFRFFSSPYEVTAEFSDATGLLKGDVVKAAGVTVGRVREIKIDHGLALVTMGIDEGTELPAEIDARIRFRNLVGQRMVTLVARDGTPSSELLASGDRIDLSHTEPAFDLSLLFNGLRPLIRSTNPADINIVTKAVSQALAGRSDEVENILGSLADVSDTLSSRDVQLTELLDNLNVVTEDLAGRGDQLGRTLANMNSFLTDVAASREDLAQALTTLDDAATRFGRIIDSNDSNIKAELDDLATILDAVNDKRADLRGALRALPDMLVAVERVNSYGEWANIHLIHVCKDDQGVCGTRGTP